MSGTGRRPTKDDVARQFGRMASAYAVSPGHASGSDLGILIGMLRLEPSMDALDVATGAGHTAAAVAPFVRSVTAIDLAPEMIAETEALATSRGLANVRGVVMDVEHLAFPDHRFDVVTCRIAPHHFLDLPAAMGEMERVLRPRGQLGLEDSCAPADAALDRFINEIETLRDTTHVRSYTEAEWRSALASAGLAITETRLYRKTHSMGEWIGRAGVGGETAERVYAALASAPRPVRDWYEVEFEDGRAVSFTDDKLILRAVKRR